ncbi:unnamed protein product, partial [Pelagomonas calceolata]
PNLVHLTDYTATTAAGPFFLVHVVVFRHLSPEHGLGHPLVVREPLAVRLDLALLRHVVVGDVDAGQAVHVPVVGLDDVVVLRAHEERHEDARLLRAHHLPQPVEGHVRGLAVRHDQYNKLRLVAVALGVPLAAQQRPQARAEWRPPARRAPVEQRLDVLLAVDLVPRRVVQKLHVEPVRVVHDEEQVRELDQGFLQLLPPRLRVHRVRRVGDLVHGAAVVGDHHDVRSRDRQQVAHDVLGQVQLVLHVPHAVAHGQVRRLVHEADNLARLLLLRDRLGRRRDGHRRRRRRVERVGRRRLTHGCA